MDPRPRGTYQLKNGVQRDRLGRHRHTRQAHAGSQGAAGGNAFAQVKLLRAQPNAVAKGAGVLQRALGDLGVDQRHFGLSEGYATSVG
jgi:hypothetical protein